MKKIFFLLLFIVTTSVFAQKEFNTNSKGYIAYGYDVVAYFDNKALKGDKKIETVYEGVKYLFSSNSNLKKFKTNPKKYIPQYGGWCAYALGAKNKKVDIDPKTFEIRDGKLYLFYNSWGSNTFKLWIKEGPEKLRKKADENWKNK